MRILILTQYYPPEIGAPQNRLHELAIRLQKEGIEVNVLTALPNYPQMKIHAEYKNKQKREEVIDGVKVYRAGIYVSNSKHIVKRLMNYFSFAWTSYYRGKKLDYYDYLMVESPPLFLGYTAIVLAKKLRAKLIFNVSDLWPESAEKLEIIKNKFALSLAYRLEAKCYEKAFIVTCQTQGIVKSINQRFPYVRTFWLPNGVDLDFYNPYTIQKENYRLEHGFSSEQLIFFYGGIVGYAQGLDVILHTALNFIDESNIQFVIQGAGPEKERLLKLKQNLKLNNVHFLDPVSKSRMPSVLKEIDVAIVPLKKIELFEGAIPSKIFETLSMEIPILLAVKGEAEDHFVRKAKAALAIEPENTVDLTEKIRILIKNPELRRQMGKNGRLYVNGVFNRNEITKRFINELVETNYVR